MGVFALLRRYATICETAQSGLKIRRRQLRGGSSPPPGTIVESSYLIHSIGFNECRDALILTDIGAFDQIWVQKQVQCASSLFSMRNEYFLVAAGAALPESYLVYARLRHALRTEFLISVGLSSQT